MLVTNVKEIAILGTILNDNYVYFETFPYSQVEIFLTIITKPANYAQVAAIFGAESLACRLKT